MGGGALHCLELRPGSRSGEVSWSYISRPLLDLFDREGLRHIRQTCLESSWVWLPPLPPERYERERGAGGGWLRSWEPGP